MMNINKNTIVLSLIILGIFAGLSTLVFYSVKMNNNYNTNNVNNLVIFDKSLNIFYTHDTNSTLFQFMKFLSDYGRDYFWPLVVIIFFVVGIRDYKDHRVVGNNVWKNRKLIIAICMTISFLVVIPATIIIKDKVDRIRPFNLNHDSLSHQNDYAMNIEKSDSSYPSGHASLVSAGATTVLLFFRQSWKQKLISLLLIIEAALVCISRLYLGVHYPLDIVGAILLGSGLSLFVSSFSTQYEKILNIKNKSKGQIQ